MKITITLNPEQEKFFHEVKYGMMCNNSSVINHILMEVALFEKIREDQVTNFLVTNHPTEYNKEINIGDWGAEFKPTPNAD